MPTPIFCVVSLVIKEHGNNIVGENYTLTCEVHAESRPNITWFGSHARIQQANASGGIILQETMQSPDDANFYTRSITFTPLLASHAGHYNCNIPLLDSYLFPVTVMCKL